MVDAVPLRVVGHPVNEEVVKVLEGMLKDAMKGDLIGLAFASHYRESLTRTWWKTGGHFYELHSAVSTLNVRMAMGD